jgi:hypothetical protein
MGICIDLANLGQVGIGKVNWFDRNLRRHGKSVAENF